MRSSLFTLLAFGLSLPSAAQSLTVNDAIQSALAQNPRITSAKAATDVASARLSQAQWDRVGRLELGALWAHELKNPQVSIPAIGPLGSPVHFDLAMQQRNNLEFGFTQPIWTWGALSGRAKAAELQADATMDQFSREQQVIRFDVSKAFLEAQQADEAVGVAEQTLTQQKAFLATAKARVAEGVAPRLDVLKAELAVSQAESDLITIRNRAKTAREGLVVVTRDDRFRSHSLAGAETTPTDLPTEGECLARAKNQRPDLKSINLQVHASRTSAMAERASGRPTVNLQANWLQRSAQISNLGDAQSRTYLVGLAVRWEGLAPKRAQARSAEFEARARQGEAQALALEDQLAFEVRTNRWQVEDAKAQVVVAERSLAQAEERARTSRVAYKAGTITAVDAEDAEVALSQARYQVILTRLNVGVALANLRLTLAD